MSAESEVAAIRGATRTLVRELKTLEGNGAVPGLSFPECHLLFEISQRGECTGTELTETLLLEKSTVSRLIGRLRRRGLVESTPSAADGRRRILRLTPAGWARAAEIDAVSNRQVAAAFDFMTPDEQRQATEAMARYGKALGYARAAADCVMRPIEPADDAAMAGVIRSVMTEFGAVGCGYSIEDPEVDALTETYRKPRSRFYIIEREGRVLGGGGIAPLKGGDEDTCELQKMYFLPELRGRGWGVPLITRCLADARGFGYRRCYLETLAHMHQARSLYRRMGFGDLSAPMGGTGHYKCNSWMLRELA